MRPGRTASVSALFYTPRCPNLAARALHPQELTTRGAKYRDTRTHSQAHRHHDSTPTLLLFFNRELLRTALLLLLSSVQRTLRRLPVSPYALAHRHCARAPPPPGALSLATVAAAHRHTSPQHGLSRNAMLPPARMSARSQHAQWRHTNRSPALNPAAHAAAGARSQGQPRITRAAHHTHHTHMQGGTRIHLRAPPHTHARARTHARAHAHAAGPHSRRRGRTHGGQRSKQGVYDHDQIMIASPTAQ